LASRCAPRLSFVVSIRLSASLRFSVIMGSTVFAVIASLAVAFPRLLSSAGICKWTSEKVDSSSSSFHIGNPHTFIQTDHSCLKQTMENAEAFGCNLKDYARGRTWRGSSMHNQAHWNLIGGDKNSFQLKKNMEVFFANGDTCAKYNVPDYCARAMLSELSTVYNGRLRTPSTMAFFKDWSGAGAQELKPCGTQSEETANHKKVFSTTPEGKSCWGMVNDWHHLLCSGYGKCICEDNTLNQCHKNHEKIQCCKQRFQEFLNLTYTNVRSASFLLEVGRYKKGRSFKNCQELRGLGGRSA